MRRRTFLVGAGLLGAAAFGARKLRGDVEVAPEIHFPGMRAGHALRDAKTLPPARGEHRTGIAILGSGVAGMACAWALARAGRHDFVLVQGPEYGGNAAGANLAIAGGDVLTCPLGAHYLPLPSTESTHMRGLLADVGLLLSGERDPAPYYDEAALSHAPQERLLRDGRWESDLLPSRGVAPEELDQQRRFFAEVADLRTRRGRDGRRLFAIPVVLSSTDPEWRALFMRHPDRFLVGTDTWVTSRWEAVRPATDAVQSWLQQLPPQVAEQIAWKNGERLFPPP